MQNKSAVCGRVVFKITTLSCSDGQKQVPLSAARARLGSLFWPGIASRVKLVVVWGNLITGAVKAPPSRGTGQSLHCVCSLPKTGWTSESSIHPRLRVGVRKRKKKVCHYREVKRSLFLQMFLFFVLVFFLLFEKKMLHSKPVNQHLLVSHCQQKAGLQLTTILTVD